MPLGDFTDNTMINNNEKMKLLFQHGSFMVFFCLFVFFISPICCSFLFPPNLYYIPMLRIYGCLQRGNVQMLKFSRSKVSFTILFFSSFTPFFTSIFSYYFLINFFTRKFICDFSRLCNFCLDLAQKI